MRFVLSGIMGAVMAWIVYARADGEFGSEFDENSPKYRPYIAGFALPFFVTGLFVVGLFVLGPAYANHTILSVCASVFLHISIYYAILLPLLPVLRKRISARACAMLWIIPNYLYLLQQEFLTLPAPWLVITIPGKLIWTIIGVWFTGFCGVMLWKLVEHLLFRRWLLQNAITCPELKTRQLWNQALVQARCRDTHTPLLVSSRITTPVTVGLFRRTSVVVLPDRPYSEAELELIFHHEIVHMGRMDAWNKFFFVFCTAMCWFNPLMWAATARSAEDLELSCDETVLLDADADTRKRYAELILRTAGDGRGFTTCLSASARTLRYRLKSIVSPRDRSTGATVVGVAFCLLALTCGMTALAYDEATGAEVLFPAGDSAGAVLTVLDWEGVAEEQPADPEEILEYLSGLRLYRLTGHYDFSEGSRSGLLKLHVPGVRTDWIFIYDSAIEVYHLGPDRGKPVLYYLPGGIDWDHLDGLLVNP